MKNKIKLQQLPVINIQLLTCQAPLFRLLIEPPPPTPTPHTHSGS